MPFRRLRTDSRFSAFSWFAIEFFLLFGLFILPFSKAAAETGLIVAIAAWNLRKILFDEPWGFAPACLPVYSLFLILSAFSLTLVLPEHLSTGMRGWLKWLESFSIFFVCYDLFQKPGRAQRFILVFFASLTLACANGFYQLWAGRDLIKGYLTSTGSRGDLIRMQGAFPSANTLAAFLLLALPAAFGCAVSKKIPSRWRMAGRVLFIFYLICFFLTLSRAAFFALVVVVAPYCVARKQFKPLLVMAVGLAVIFVFSGNLRHNFIDSLMNPKDITIGERVHYWNVTMGMIRTHPFIGNGVNLYAKKFQSFSPTQEAYAGYAHNSYLQMWSEIGIFGLLVFLFPLFYFIPKALKQNELEWPSALRSVWAVGLTAFLLQAFLDTHFYSFQTSVLFWMSWALLVRWTIPSR